MADTEDKIDKILEMVSTMKLDLAVHIEREESRNEKLQKVYNAVFGKNGDPSQSEMIRDNAGHISRVEKKIEDAFEDFKITLWKILGPTFAALGIGILLAIISGADKITP